MTSTHTLMGCDDIPFDLEPEYVPDEPVSEPYLVRETGDGIRIEMSWDIACTVRFDVVLNKSSMLLDSYTLPVADWRDGLHHPAMHSEVYAEALR